MSCILCSSKRSSIKRLNGLYVKYCKIMMVFAAGYLQVVPKVRSSTLKACNAVGLNFINKSLKQKLSFNLIKYFILVVPSFD